jgi:hypothetical protein
MGSSVTQQYPDNSENAIASAQQQQKAFDAIGGSLYAPDLQASVYQPKEFQPWKADTGIAQGVAAAGKAIGSALMSAGAASAAGGSGGIGATEGTGFQQMEQQQVATQMPIMQPATFQSVSNVGTGANFMDGGYSGLFR